MRSYFVDSPRSRKNRSLVRVDISEVQKKLFKECFTRQVRGLLKAGGTVILIATIILPILPASSFAINYPSGGYFAEDHNVIPTSADVPQAWDEPIEPDVPQPPPPPAGNDPIVPESPILLNGGLNIAETDAVMPTRVGGSISLTRRYNSKLWAYASSAPFPQPNGGNSTCLFRIGKMGLGWDFNPGEIVKDGYSDNYIWTDGEGEVHVLYKISGDTLYETRDGTYIKGTFDPYADYDQWSWILMTKSGTKLLFNWDVCAQYSSPSQYKFHLGEVIDTHGNRIRYYWNLDVLAIWQQGDPLDSILTSSGQKMTLFWRYEGPTYLYHVLDSIKTLGPNGQWRTVKYEYLSPSFGCPWGGSFYDESSNAVQTSATSLTLKKVIFPNNTYEEYTYNSYGELTAIQKSSGEVTEYTYDTYTYSRKKDSGTETCKTRHITKMTVSPDNGATDYIWGYNRIVSPDSISPHKLIVTAPDNSKTEYLFKSGSPTSTPPVDNGALLGQTVLSPSDEVLRKVQYGYWIRNNTELLTDTVATIIGTKNYVTRYRDYDAFANPGRIENLGDVSTDTDDRVTYLKYLHDSYIITAKTSGPLGAKIGTIVTISIPFSSNTGVYLTKLYCDGALADSQNFSPSQSGTRYYYWNTTGAKERIYYFYSKAYDVSGNGSKSGSIGISLGYENPPPGSQTSSKVSSLVDQYDDDHRHILDRPIQQYDSLSTTGKLAEIKFRYDDYGKIDTTSYSSYPPIMWENPHQSPRGLVTAIKRWTGTSYDSTLMYYDQCGNLVKTVNPKRDSSKVIYAPSYDPDKYQYAFPWRTVNYLENGDSLYTTAEYDTATGLPLSVTDANGNTAYYKYDDFKRLTKVARPGDWSGTWPGWTSGVTPSIISHYYDEIFPQKCSVVDSVKITQSPLVYLETKTFYDGSGRGIQTQKRDTDGYSIIVNTAYDSLSNIRKVSNPIKTTTTFGTYVTTDYWSSQPKKVFYYDALGRPIKAVNQDGTKDSIAYINNRITTYDALNHSTTEIKNSFGSPDTVIDALDHNTVNTYDHLGQVTSVTDAHSKITYYYYDKLGRLRGTNGPDASSSYTYNGNSVDVLLEYDAVGNVIWRKNSKGEIKYVYDALSRIVEEDSASSSYPKVKYLYDTYAGSNYTTPPDSFNKVRGRLAMQVTVGTDTTWFVYDKLGRVRKRIYAYAGMSGGRDSLLYHYNSASACTALVYPDNSVVKYNYNSTSGRLEKIPNFVNSFAFNPAGQISKITYANNVTTNLSYNSRLRPTSIRTEYLPALDGELLHLAYAYTDNSNISQITNLVDATKNQTYTYDNLNRLTQVSLTINSQPSTINYGYDAVGNRLSETVGSSTSTSTLTYTYTPGTNRLESLSSGISFSYDATGSITSRSDGKNYSYDYKNQLTKFSCGNTTVDLTYNGAGLRIKKRVTTTTIVPGEPYQIASIPEPFEDLTYKAPDGDSLHDNARDLGEMKVHSNDNWLFFELEHKYLYGTAQGQYSKIFISLDTDTIPGSGNTYFPEGTNTAVLPEAAWEYCIYVNDENSFGLYNQWYVKTEKPSIGGKKMTVNYTGGGPNARVKIKVPKELIGNPEFLRFVIMTTKPGFVNTDSLNNGTSTATDVAPGGATAVEGGIIYKYVDYLPPRHGTRIVTVKTTLYIYEGINPLVEMAENGNITAKYIYALGQHVTKVDAFGPHYYHSDHLGSPRLITNSDGDVEKTYEYYPFGKVLSETGTLVNDITFAGKEYLAEIGTYDLFARHYDPELGRFYSVDPINNPAVSPYVYCVNNPLRYIDPTGMISGYKMFVFNPSMLFEHDPGWVPVWARKWTDASGEPQDLRLRNPREEWLREQLERIADADPEQRQAIIDELNAQGVYIVITYTSGEQECYYPWTYVAGPRGGPTSEQEERMSQLKETAKRVWEVRGDFHSWEEAFLYFSTDPAEYAYWNRTDVGWTGKLGIQVLNPPTCPFYRYAWLFYTAVHWRELRRR